MNREQFVDEALLSVSDAELEAFLTNWKPPSAYDPRRDMKP